MGVQVRWFSWNIMHVSNDGIQLLKRDGPGADKRLIAMDELHDVAMTLCDVCSLYDAAEFNETWDYALVTFGTYTEV